MPTILIANALPADRSTDPQPALPGLGDLADELLRNGRRSTVALVTVGLATQPDTLQLTLDIARPAHDPVVAPFDAPTG